MLPRLSAPKPATNQRAPTSLLEHALSGQSSAATQQIAASSADLAQMATSLQGLVETFRR